MQSPSQSDQFWTEVQQTCEALNSDIYLPSDIEAHLKRTSSEQHHSHSYPHRLRAALDPVDNIFDLENSRSSADESFVVFDSHLKAIQDKLQSIVSSLEQSSTTVRNSADSLANSRLHAAHASNAVNHISDFIAALRLPEDIHNRITVSNPHSHEFKHALAVLSQFLATCHSRKDALAVQEVLPSATSLRYLAIRRIEERLRDSFRYMKEPSSSFTILRDTLLLQQRPLIHFLKDHARASFDSVAKEYVQVAKLAFGFQLRAFYDQLSSCGALPTKRTISSTFVGSSATRLLASLWDSSSSSQEPREGEDQVIGYEHSKQVGSLEKLTEGISDLSKECVAVLGGALDPPLTTAEVQLMKQSPALSFSSLFRQLVSFFLKYEKSESRFVVELFADESKEFLGEIFTTTENPLLGCLKLRCQSLESALDIEQLCLSLYVCRRIRENVKLPQELDHRISSCVVAERVLQTQFASQLDAKAALARELLLQEIWDGTANITSYSEATWFSVSIARCLVIVRLGDEWISSRDMGYALRRRLFSSVGCVVSVVESIQGEHSDNEIGIKSYLRFVVSFLFAIDTCLSLEKEKCEATEEIRAQVGNSFQTACNAYAQNYEKSRLQEVSQIERSCTTFSFDEGLRFVTALLEKLENIAHLIREDVKFLQDDLTGGIYEDEAIGHILTSLQHRIESVKLALSSHHPELTAKIQCQHLQ